MKTLEQRVDRLERSLRWWRCGAVLLAAVLCWRVFGGAAEPEVVGVVKTHSLQVVNDDGKLVAGIDENGERVFGGDSKAAVWLSAALAQAQLTLVDSKNHTAAVLASGTGAADGSTLQLYSKGRQSVWVDGFDGTIRLDASSGRRWSAP